MPKVPEAVRMFAPERWGEVDRFRVLWPTTYKFEGFQKRVVAGVENHFHKALTLLQIAESLIPSLEVDETELEVRGFTPAQNARKLAAVLEGVITELYSVVDCTAKVLHLIYGPTSSRYKDSTRRLFAEADKITGSFPERLKNVIRAVTWYEELRRIRDELTHRDVGSCSKDPESEKIRYFHSSLWEGERLKPIEDIFGWVRTNVDAVNQFIGVVFNELNSNIKAGTVHQVCGMVEGRILMRMLDVAQPIDFDNGTCLSAQWFTEPENPDCPFAGNCGAFARRASPDLLREVFGES
ncbi:MAG: hypothetical protein WBA51_05875 [Erythrobacter sp.]